MKGEVIVEMQHRSSLSLSPPLPPSLLSSLFSLPSSPPPSSLSFLSFLSFLSSLSSLSSLSLLSSLSHFQSLTASLSSSLSPPVEDESFGVMYISKGAAE